MAKKIADYKEENETLRQIADEALTKAIQLRMAVEDLLAILDYPMRYGARITVIPSALWNSRYHGLDGFVGPQGAKSVIVRARALVTRRSADSTVKSQNVHPANNGGVITEAGR